MIVIMGFLCSIAGIALGSLVIFQEGHILGGIGILVISIGLPASLLYDSYKSEKNYIKRMEEKRKQENL